MANPQKENGYTAIANEIMEALCRIRISGEARQVLDVMIRKTYGFNKSEDRIALSQICLATGLKKQTACKAINKLIDMNLITKKDTYLGNVYRFNKDFDQWKPLPKKVTLPKKVKGVTNKGNNRNPKSDIQKTITKDTITKDIAETSSADVVRVIDSFEVVNPTFKKWYGNTTQRKAIQGLLDSHGIDKVLSVIAILPKTNGLSYVTTITTPLQLEDKWATLEAQLRKLKSERSKNIIVKI